MAESPALGSSSSMWLLWTYTWINKHGYISFRNLWTWLKFWDFSLRLFVCDFFKLIVVFFSCALNFYQIIVRISESFICDHGVKISSWMFFLVDLSSCISWEFVFFYKKILHILGHGICNTLASSCCLETLQKGSIMFILDGATAPFLLWKRGSDSFTFLQYETWEIFRTGIWIWHCLPFHMQRLLNYHFLHILKKFPNNNILFLRSDYLVFFLLDMPPGLSKQGLLPCLLLCLLLLVNYVLSKSYIRKPIALFLKSVL